MSELKDKIEEIENKSNNEILFELKQMEADYEALKIKMLRDFDKMVEIEKIYERSIKILVDRLKTK